MAKRPNILYILSDDQGAWAMHCAGNPEIHTPNLDHLAEQGIRFDDFFCVSPVCSPARASLLTGDIPSSHGVQDWIRSGNVDAEKYAAQGKENPYGGYVDERTPIQYLKGKTTYTDVLVENGYTCALSGKWHLGDSVTPQHGFSRWYTIGKGGAFYYHPDMVENGKITVEHGKYITDLITDRALDFMDELAQGDDPFYLAVHYTAPHSPWEADQHPAEYIDLYRDCPFESIPDVPDHPGLTVPPVYGTPLRRVNLTGYFAAITAMDANIGRLLDRLEEKGLAENTIVIFNADNGMNMGHHGIWGKGNGTFPQNMFDTSVKVPFIFSYPGHAPQGVVNHDMISAYDLFPTLLDLLGIDNRVTQRLPGRSFAPVLRGEPLESRDEIVVFDEYGPVRMIRSKTHKLVLRYPYGPNEFYDLVADPGEENNLYDDPAYEEQIVSMRAHMERWFNDYADPDIDGTRSEVTGLGQLCRPGIYATRRDVFAARKPVEKPADQK